MIQKGEEILRKGEVAVYKCREDYMMYIGDELWMWDTSEEREDQELVAEKAYGDVLVGGYGFGLVQRYLLTYPQVNTVLTVEINNQVLEVAKEIYGKIYGDVEIGNFYTYNPNRKFNCVVGDLWKDQSVRYIELYKCFREKAESLIEPGGRILGWGFEYMEYLRNKGDRNS